jgi:hypothetical protein
MLPEGHVARHEGAGLDVGGGKVRASVRLRYRRRCLTARRFVVGALSHCDLMSEAINGHQRSSEVIREAIREARRAVAL